MKAPERKRATMAHSETPQASKWATRFILATVIQGTLAVVLTAYLLYQGVFGTPAASRIVAGGGAGMWLTVGYFGYLVLGPLTMAAIAFFYQFLEVRLHKRFRGWTSGLAWASLVMWNVGVVGATWLMMHAGYRGGAAALPTMFGGLGWTSAQIHGNIMVAYPPYIAGFMAVALVGAFLGVISFLAVWSLSARTPSEAPKTATH